MKIKTILIAVMLSVSALTHAQVSKDAFGKAVDFINCKTVELSIKTDANNYNKYTQTCPCGDLVTYSQIKKFLNSVGTFDKTILLSSEIESLKNTFKDGLKNDDALRFLSDSIFTEKVKYQKLFSFANKRKVDKDFATYKEGLKEDLPAILETITQASNTSQENSESKNQVNQPTLDERISDLEQRPKPKVVDKDWFEGLTFQIDVFSIIISVVVMSLILKLVYGRRHVSESIKNYVKSEISNAPSESSGYSAFGTSSFEVNKLKDEIEKLRGEVKQLSYKIESSKIPLEIVQPRNEQPSWQEPKQTEEKTEIFFLSTPNSDGSFNDSSVSLTYKEGASIYRFTKVGNNRAKFQIDEREASVKLALTYPDKSIDPVCDAVNAFNPKAKRITTVDVGEAELLNDKWMVNKSQKAKISYES
jgi:hypothetical protein